MQKDDARLRQLAMRDIDALLSRLDVEDDMRGIQTQIADLIFEIIDFRIGALDNWEKLHLANAIGSLGLNVNSPSRNGWLRLCLSDLKEALKPEAERSYRYDAQTIGPGELSSKHLLKALDSIRRKIGSDAG